MVAPSHYPEFEYSVTFSAPFQVQGGVKYWVSIINSPTSFWGWEASASPLNPGVQRRYLGDTWQPYYDNTAFQVMTVPETDDGFLIAALGAFILSGLPQHRQERGLTALVVPAGRRLLKRLVVLHPPHSLPGNTKLQ